MGYIISVAAVGYKTARPARLDKALHQFNAFRSPICVDKSKVGLDFHRDRLSRLDWSNS